MQLGTELQWLVQVLVSGGIAVVGFLIVHTLNRMNTTLDRVSTRLDKHETRLSNIEGWREAREYISRGKD